MMINYWKKWLGMKIRKLTIWTWSSSTIDEVHSIQISEMKEPNEDFPYVIVAALELLRTTDPRRFKRVTHHLDWIINQYLPFETTAQYQHWARACIIDFEKSWPERDLEFSAGYHATILIHEATHGYLKSRGIPYNESNRERVEALCVKEQNRWAASLIDQELGADLHEEFEPKNWEIIWNAKPRTRFFSLMKRMLSDEWPSFGSVFQSKLSNAQSCDFSEMRDERASAS